MSAPDTTLYDHQASGPQPWDQISNPNRVLDDPPDQTATMEDRFSRENGTAMPVNQRSPRHWSGHTMSVDAVNSTQLVPSQVGRKTVTILVPPTAPAAAWIDSQQSTLELASPLGFYLAVGASLTIETEGSVYAVSAGVDTLLSVAVTWG